MTLFIYLIKLALLFIRQMALQVIIKNLLVKNTKEREQTNYLLDENVPQVVFVKFFRQLIYSLHAQIKLLKGLLRRSFKIMLKMAITLNTPPFQMNSVNNFYVERYYIIQLANKLNNFEHFNKNETFWLKIQAAILTQQCSFEFKWKRRLFLYLNSYYYYCATSESKYKYNWLICEIFQFFHASQ